MLSLGREIDGEVLAVWRDGAFAWMELLLLWPLSGFSALQSCSEIFLPSPVCFLSWLMSQVLLRSG